MNQEDKDLARQMVQAEQKKNAELFNRLGIPLLEYGPDGLGKNSPSGDGDKMLVSMFIGDRGSLSKQRARVSAKTWRETTQRYPKALFLLGLRGYDEDPRDIWEIYEAARYVRWWAKYAGMDDVEVADHFVGPGSAIASSGLAVGGDGLAFLACCGVFGDDVKQRSLAGFIPTAKN